MRRFGHFVWGVVKAIGRMGAIVLASVATVSGRSRLPNPDQRRDYDKAAAEERRALWGSRRRGR